MNKISKIIETYKILYNIVNLRQCGLVEACDLHLCLYNENKDICNTVLSGNLNCDNLHKELVTLAQEIELGEIAPVAIINNKSVVFMARSINNVFPKNGRILPEKIKKIITNILHDFDNEYLQKSEVESNNKYALRYWVHKNIIKRLFLTKKIKRSKEFESVLLDKLTAGTIIDVSCGDNTILDNLKNKGFTVYNDISLIYGLNRKLCKKTLFTNHDATKLPFDSKIFDAAICRNTLHHMPSDKHLNNLFNSLSKVSKKIVFVEIENPEIASWLPKLLNKYLYRKFLHDVGARYLDQDEFKKLISDRFKKVTFSNFRNICGNYMIAEVLL